MPFKKVGHYLHLRQYMTQIVRAQMMKIKYPSVSRNRIILKSKWLTLEKLLRKIQKDK